MELRPPKGEIVDCSTSFFPEDLDRSRRNQLRTFYVNELKAACELSAVLPAGDPIGHGTCRTSNFPRPLTREQHLVGLRLFESDDVFPINFEICGHQPVGFRACRDADNLTAVDCYDEFTVSRAYIVTHSSWYVSNALEKCSERNFVPWVLIRK